MSDAAVTYKITGFRALCQELGEGPNIRTMILLAPVFTRVLGVLYQELGADII